MLQAYGEAHMARDEMRVKAPESESGSSLDDGTVSPTARLNRFENPGVRSTKHIYTHLPDPTGWEMIATCLKSPGLGAVCNVKQYIKYSSCHMDVCTCVPCSCMCIDR